MSEALDRAAIQPECRCGHTHSSHQHHRRGTECSHPGCSCTRYRRLIYTRGEFRARVADLQQRLDAALDTIAAVRLDLHRAEAREEAALRREQAAEQALINFAALSKYSGAAWRLLYRPFHRRPPQIPRQRVR